MVNSVFVTCNKYGLCAIVVRFQYESASGVVRTKTQTSFSPQQAMTKLNRSRYLQNTRNGILTYDEVYEKLLTLERLTIVDGICLTPRQFEEAIGKFPFEVHLSI